ncbi:MAG: ATP synthase F1 subunit gamma [Candidatus Tectomicrobia bacterium]|uniref:ATP synthase gamma chain n=1 Tax=Tectimicrobiota bacterium TaxID=2528274 RepID=A0A932HXY3_UNCTE|nr:ATP synthase F1 subunit gamma [Candidatus Tectomicrobia bacterium]
MPSLRDYRRRIRSVKNTQQITRAMKLVAASKVRRAQERIEGVRPYSEKMGELVNSLAQKVDPALHPLLHDEMKDDKVLLLVITSDKGLCGGYNAAVNRLAFQFLRRREEQGKETGLVIVGRKGRAFFARRGYAFKREFTEVYGKINFRLGQDIAALLMQSYLEEGYDEVHVLTTEFFSILRQAPRLSRLLPLAPPVPAAVNAQGEPVPGGVDYLYEPSVLGVLTDILPRHITVQVYRALLDAEASEFGARMRAMDSATNNAAEMIRTLTLRMNRVRQATITKEILEVVSGADALKG